MVHSGGSQQKQSQACQGQHQGAGLEPWSSRSDSEPQEATEPNLYADRVHSQVVNFPCFSAARHFHAPLFLLARLLLVVGPVQEPMGHAAQPFTRQQSTINVFQFGTHKTKQCLASRAGAGGFSWKLAPKASVQPSRAKIYIDVLIMIQDYKYNEGARTRRSEVTGLRDTKPCANSAA